MNREIKLKIIIIGDCSVGKSSILKSFINKQFEEWTSPTLGVDFLSTKVKIGSDVMNLALWDTAGSEKYNALTPNFYRKTHGAILVYDVTKRKTLEDLRTWRSELLNYADTSVPCLLLGNKIDCENERVVSFDEGETFAHNFRMMFMECSAKTLQGVDFAFEELILKIKDTPGLWQYEPDSTHSADDETSSDKPCNYC